MIGHRNRYFSNSVLKCALFSGRYPIFRVENKKQVQYIIDRIRFFAETAEDFLHYEVISSTLKILKSFEIFSPLNKNERIKKMFDYGLGASLSSFADYLVVPEQIEAIRRGVNKVFIIDGRVPHSILIETLTDEGIGTMLV